MTLHSLCIVILICLYSLYLRGQETTIHRRCRVNVERLTVKGRDAGDREERQVSERRVRFVTSNNDIFWNILSMGDRHYNR